MTYFFDIDGTLLDSAPDISAAVREVSALAGLPEMDQAVIRQYIGRTLVEMFSDFCPGAPADEIERLCGLYRDQYRARAHRDTQVFPGIAAMLSALPGRKSTATTKSTATAAAVLEQFGLRGYFDHVQGSDDGRYKPDPAILLEAVEVMRVAPRECVMVGDSLVDIEAGRRAGMLTCAVGWGYGDREALRSLRPDYWIDSPGQLLGLAP